jgi:magnesium chelatase subunit H
VPLGGLVGDNIFLVPERVKRLANRLHKWVALRRTPPQVSAEGGWLGVVAGARPRAAADVRSVCRTQCKLLAALAGMGPKASMQQPCSAGPLRRNASWR